MELLYVWIEESSNGFIREQGFNFSREHRFRVEEKDNEYTLKYEKVTSPPPNLYEGTNIQNITAIVGENGSGKSTVLREILENKKHLMLFKSNDSFFIEHDNNIKQIKVDGKSINLIKNDKKITFIKYASTLLNESKCEPKNANISVIDHSNRGVYEKLIDDNHLNTQSMENRNLAYLTDMNIINLIYFFAKNKQFLKEEFKFDFKYISIEPNAQYSFLKFTDYDNIESKNTTKDDKAIEKRKNQMKHFNEVWKGKIENLIGCKLEELKNTQSIIEQNSPDKSLLFKNIFIIVLYNLIHDRICKNQYNLEEDIKKLKKLKFNIDFSRKTKVSNLIKKAYTIFGVELEYCMGEKDTISEILTYINKVNALSYKNTQYTVFGVDLDNKFIEFMDLIVATKYFKAFKLNYINSQHDNIVLSSGELQALTLLSRIDLMFNSTTKSSQLFEKINHDCKNVIIVLDEPETHLHPEWSRKLIYILTEYLKTKSDYKFQIIFTTNSPFMLSDLPKENIIYMEKGKINKEINIDTFGANIHTLLKDSFFMDSTIGEFAMRKILTVNRRLSWKKELSPTAYKKVVDLIDIIGEPIIKNYLTDKLQDNLSKSEQIKLLEDRLKQLKGEKNDKN